MSGVCRDETLPELAEDIERLARLAYPEALETLTYPEVLETLTKDQFTDALNDDQTRLRVAQARPTSLRAALGIALEIESFSLAARRRVRPVRTVHESLTKTNTESFVDLLEETWKRNSEFLAELKKTTSELVCGFVMCATRSKLFKVCNWRKVESVGNYYTEAGNW